MTCNSVIQKHNNLILCFKLLQLYLEQSKASGHLLSVPELLDKTFTATDKNMKEKAGYQSGCTTIVAVVRNEPASGKVGVVCNRQRSSVIR